MSSEPTPLDRIATIIREALAAEPWGGPPRLFAIDGPLGAAEFNLLTRELDCHPVDALLDLDVPASWSALGVAAEGKVRSMDNPSAESTDRARTLVFADRSGRLAGGGDLRSGGTLPGPPPEGHVVDALLRALGVPTAPPAAPATQLVAVGWLSAVVRTALDTPKPLTWRAVAALQPQIDVDDFDWTSLRRAAVDRRWTCSGVTPAQAAKLDDGSFARLALADHAGLADLLAEARSLLPASVVRRIRQTLRSWEVPSY